MTSGIRPSKSRIEQMTRDFSLEMPVLWSVMPMDIDVILAPHKFSQQTNIDHQRTLHVFQSL